MHKFIKLVVQFAAMIYHPNSEIDLTLSGIPVHTYFFNYNPKNPPAIILHGLRADTERTMPFINLLKDRFNIVCIDLPGFGKTKETGEFEDYTVYSARVFNELLKALELKDSETTVFGISNGANIAIQYLIEDENRSFIKLGLVAPIYSYEYLSMSPAFKHFVYWFAKSLMKKGFITKIVQKIISNDRAFLIFNKLLDREHGSNLEIARYEMVQWRLMSMQHWGKTLWDFLHIDLSKTQKVCKQKSIIFVYPKHDQYLDIKASIKGFQKLFPNAHFDYLESNKHIPRGNLESNLEFMQSVKTIVSKFI